MISYNQTSNVYTLSNLYTSPISFSDANATIGPVAGYKYFSVTDPVNSSLKDTIIVYDNTQAAAPLKYTSFGLAIVPSSSTQSLGATVFGLPTTTQPVTGAATYSGTIGGVGKDANGTYILTGTSRLVADLGSAGAYVNAYLDFSGTNVQSGGPSLVARSYNSYGNTSPVNPIKFTGTFGTVGAYAGSFYGPNAEEYGLAFSINDSGFVASGAAVGGYEAQLYASWPILKPSITLSPAYTYNVTMPNPYSYAPAETLANALANGATNNLNLVYQASYTAGWAQGTQDRLSYDAATNSYTYYVSSGGSGPTGTAYSFPQTSLVTPSSNSPFSGGNFLTLSTINSAKNDVTSLIILKPGASNGLINLTYTGFGLVSLPSTVGGESAVDSGGGTNYFVFGNITAGTIPTGSATYSGITNGIYHDSHGNYITQGTTTLAANFDSTNVSHSVTTTLSFTGTNLVAGGPALGLTTFSGGGAPGAAGAAFSGNLSGPTGSGQFFGNFYGPAAAEFGYVYYLGTSIPGQASITGSGAAVGKKN